MGSDLRIQVDSSDPDVVPPPFVLPRPLDADVRRLAGAEVTVLLEGESGTRKSRIAKHLHELSPRAEAPFRRVDCAALGGGVLESEVFGHLRFASETTSNRSCGEGFWAVVRESFHWAEAEVEITGRAVRRLEEYGWPGNIRELKHVLCSALLASGLAASPRVEAGGC